MQPMTIGGATKLFWIGKLLGIGLIAALVPQCLNVDVAPLGSPRPPNQFSTISLLASVPDRPYNEIGTIRIECGLFATYGDALARATSEAQELGADAVVIHVDGDDSHLYGQDGRRLYQRARGRILEVMAIAYPAAAEDEAPQPSANEAPQPSANDAPQPSAPTKESESMPEQPEHGSAELTTAKGSFETSNFD